MFTKFPLQIFFYSLDFESGFFARILTRYFESTQAQENCSYLLLTNQAGLQRTVHGCSHVLKVEHTTTLCRPGAICGLSLLLVLVLLRGFFSGFSGFPPSTKTNIFKSSSTRIEDPHENQLRLMGFLSKY